jgi:hypothetical protein
MMFITDSTLRAARACHEQRVLFRRCFPNGVVVTQGLCVMYAFDFDFGWAGCYLLSGDNRDSFLTAMFKLRRDSDREVYVMPACGCEECVLTIREIEDRRRLAVAELFAKHAMEEI